MPLLGNFIDKAHVEPLHLKNNAWQFFFKSVPEEALRKSKVAESIAALTDSLMQVIEDRLGSFARQSSEKNGSTVKQQQALKQA